MKLKQLLFGGFLAITSFSQAQCPQITCPSDTTISADPGNCDAVVTFTAPQGTDPCASGNVTFTNCGITGRFGPTQGEVNTEYSGGPLDGDVTVNTQGIQEWTVPYTGTYTIEVAGAAGGDETYYGNYNGGDGATMIGEFNLTAGDVLMVLVGQQGESDASGGGGGGTFVVSGGNPLIIAGGGGGASTDMAGIDAVTTNDGTMDSQNLFAGGTGGNGGMACTTANGNNGGAGAGFQTDGTSPNSGGGSETNGYGGLSFLNGGIGGEPGRDDGSCSEDAFGGFGGGGSTTCITVAGGGGGGYSGGAGGVMISQCSASQRTGGGGGGSFNSGTNQNNTPGSNAGHGYVNISWTGANATTTQTAGLPSGSTFPVGTTVQTFEATDGNGGNPVTCSFNVIVTSGIDVNVSVNEITLTADNSNADTYQWIDCSDDSPVSGETSQSFTATANGDYAVIITEGNCTDTSACQTISTVGTEEYNMTSDIVVYPNPNDGQFTVNFGQKVAEAEINIIDVQGRTVETYNLNNVSSKEINMTDYSGAYMINVATENGNQTFRVVIQK